MLDVHTHILPGMDDGCRRVEQSIAMLETEAEQGVDTVVMTPHYDAGRESPAEFARRRGLAEDQLLDALGNQGGMPNLLSGAEVAFFEGLSRVEELEPLCIGGARFMLVEMPFCAWNRRMISELEALRQIRGVRPILAHVERYRSCQSAGVLGELKDKGFWLQCNASFFLRWQTSWQAMNMLRRRQIHFVASDCHSLEHRPPNLGTAMDKIGARLGKDARIFLRENEERLLGG